MKKMLIIFVSLIGVASLFTGCGGANVSPEVQNSFDTKAKLYTTRNMHYNIVRGGAKLIETTDYQVGILIPVNSEVTMEDINKKQIIFLYNGEEIILRNQPKYSGVDISKIAEQYFSQTKINLNSFSSTERKAIKFAQVVPNMSKKAVLISLGTPPAHVTPSTEMDQWKYWKTRWSTFFINFENGRTINGTEATNQPSQQNHGVSIRIN